MGKYSKLGKNTFLLFIGSIGGKMITFIMLPFYTMWLSVKDYGVVDLLGVYVSFIVPLVACCIAEAIFIFPKGLEKKEQSSYFSSGLFFALCTFSLAAIIFGVTYAVLTRMGIENSFTNYTWVIFLMIFTSFIQSYVQQFARSLDFVKVYATSGILQTAAIALFSFLLIPSFGVLGFIFANSLSALLTASFSFVSIKAYNYIKIHTVSILKIREMLTYSIPLIPNVVMWWLIGALNRPIMEHTLGTEAIGLFAVANKFPSIITVCFGIFVSSWQMSVVEEFKKEGYGDFYNKILRIIFFVLTLISLLLGFFSEYILQIATDAKFADAKAYVPLLCIAVLLSSMSGMVGTNFTATRQSKYFFYSSVWGALASVGLSFLLIPTWGLWGASLAIVLSHATMASARIINSWKYAKIQSAQLYAMMLLINIALVILLHFCSSILYRYLGFTILLSGFLIVNKDILADLKSNLKYIRKK